MKRFLSLWVLGVLLAVGLSQNGAWAKDYRPSGWWQHANYHAKQNAPCNDNRYGNNQWHNGGRQYNAGGYGGRYDNRRSDNMRAMVNRQESLVNSLQNRVDDYRRRDRTDTAAYRDALRQLRVAQADYQRMKNQLISYSW
jgi:hypothetical protein